MAALLGGSSAQAQEATQSQSSQPQPVEQVVVTGTLITRDGYNAPTPVSVLSGDDINALQPANIADLVRTLPAVTAAGGLSPSNSTGSISSATAGLNTMSLRGLGDTRTLVLLNGQRSVASTSAGEVDINTFPQDLIERVDVVTGGASAQYGSDAVAGVINFVLNEKFQGTKISADAGITTYGDGFDHRLSATSGLSFFNDRLHVLLNGEYYHADGTLVSSRPWNNSGSVLINNPLYVAGNGQPQYYYGQGIGPATQTGGGLVNSGPLRGTYFLAPGITGQLNYGINNAPSNPFMIGGDWQTTQQGLEGSGTLSPSVTRAGIFVRPSFDITDDFNIYGQFSWNRNYTEDFYEKVENTSVTIPVDNAYLVSQYPNVAAQMRTLGLSSISIGTSNVNLPTDGLVSNRDVYRYVAGGKGRVSLFGRDWSWDAYYQHGASVLNAATEGSPNTTREALAQDAVISNGEIVCRSTLTNPANGCVPLDRLGTSTPSLAALNYVYGPQQPSEEVQLTEDVASLTVNGTLFALPGGDTAIAFGGDWRNERIGGNTNLSGQSWYSGNFTAVFGSYDVKEAFTEVDMPVLHNLDLNAAGRYTDYSTSGTVYTWKLGSNYEPIDGLRLRGTYSHDVRAPNLSELYSPGAGVYLNATFPTNAPVTGDHLNLKPEEGNTWTAGAVATPSFLPDFSVSLDYFDIDLKHTIGTLSAQQVINYCYSGAAPQLCSGIQISGGQVQSISIAPYNFGSQKVSGLDAEASYNVSLAEFSSELDGNIRLHAQSSYYFNDIINNLVQSIDYTGTANVSNGGFGRGVPRLSYRASIDYNLDPYDVALFAHGVGSSVYLNNAVQCASSCPVSTTQNPTINDNYVPGEILFDGSVSMKLKIAGYDSTISFIVNNMLNKNPPLTGFVGTSSGDEGHAQSDYNLFDLMGRTFHVNLTVMN